MMNKIYTAFAFCTLLIANCYGQTIVTKTNTQVKFKVDEVKLATTLLFEEDLSKSLGKRLKREIKFIPAQYQKTKIVPTIGNSFIGTIQNCYNDHRPLILTPDAVWLCITQGLSIHINQHFDKYKNLLFKDTTNAKIELLVREDNLSFKKDYWTKSITAISKKANQEVNTGYYSFFVPQFSTSDSITKTVMEITMLDAFKQKFIYLFESGCGIPTLTIKGVPQDWQWIYDNLQILNQFDLKDWADELKPVIQEFINASNNKVNIPFWKDIYKNVYEYNAHYISGWIIKLFPYLEETEHLDWSDTTKNYNWNDSVKIIYKQNKYIYANQYLKSTISTDDFPSGISNSKLIWNDYYKETTTDLELFAGFLGVKQYKDKSLEPFICWTLTSYSNESIKSKPRSYIPISHNKEYWSPNFAKHITDSAVLVNKKYNTTTKSIDYIKKRIVEQIETGRQFADTSYKGKTVVFEILSNGTVGSVYSLDTVTYQNLNYFNDVSNYSNNFSTYIKSILNTIDEKWYPALAHPVDVLEISDAPINLTKIKVKVNSFIKIIL